MDADVAYSVVAVGTPITRRPPHRSVRARLTHTALTVDAWRQKRKSDCSPHTAQSVGHAFPRSVSGTCKIERCSPQSAPFPPQPPLKVTLRCSAGSRVLRHSPTSPERSCPAVRFMAFADRPSSFDQGVQEISRFSCMLFLSVRGFLDYAGPINPLALYVVAVLPSSTRNGVGVLFHRLFEVQ